MFFVETRCIASLQQTRDVSLRRQKTQDVKHHVYTTNPRREASRLYKKSETLRDRVSTKNRRRFAITSIQKIGDASRSRLYKKSETLRDRVSTYNELDKTDFQAKVEANKNFISHFTQLLK